MSLSPSLLPNVPSWKVGGVEHVREDDRRVTVSIPGDEVDDVAFPRDDPSAEY